VEGAARLDFDEGCRLEQELFLETLYSDQSKAMIHMFFAEREMGKAQGVDREAILKRLTAAIAAEGDRLLAEGLAPSVAYLDAAAVTGLGFPRWRGGPMFARKTTSSSKGRE
jgi:hypothetical protein